MEGKGLTQRRGVHSEGGPAGGCGPGSFPWLAVSVLLLDCPR